MHRARSGKRPASAARPGSANVHAYSVGSFAGGYLVHRDAEFPLWRGAEIRGDLSCCRSNERRGDLGIAHRKDSPVGAEHQTAAEMLCKRLATLPFLLVATQHLKLKPAQSIHTSGSGEQEAPAHSVPNPQEKQRSLSQVMPRQARPPSWLRATDCTP